MAQKVNFHRSPKSYETENIAKGKVVNQYIWKFERKLQTLDVVEIRVKHKNDGGSTYMEALCIPQICSPIKKPKHIRNI